MSILVNSSLNKVVIESSRAINVKAQSPSVVVAPLGIQGEQGIVIDNQTLWMSLARGYDTQPTFLQTVISPSSGDVYQYDYIDGTRYRFIADNGSLDAFYETFTDSVLDDFVVEKRVTLG